MNAPFQIAPPGESREPSPEVTAKVAELFSKAPAFQQLSRAQQEKTLHDTALIADALVPRNEPAMASAASRAMAGGNDQWQTDQAAVDAIGKDPFTAAAAREGAAVAGEFLKQVNFVDFVSGLIDGVFNSIVTSNIQQMEAYSKMVSDVAKSLDDFRDDNTTSEDGKQSLIEKFPDVFDLGVDEFSENTQPQLKVKDGADLDAALPSVKSALGPYADKPIESIDVSDPEVQETLIKAARSEIATSRQQLLATMVLMGLSRIVVTTGKLSAKILYDFNASTQRNLSRNAMAMDYARDSLGNVQYGADFYTKGLYRFTRRPTMTAESVAGDVQADTLTAKANLAGAVEVNFKSDYLPLEKMANSEMIAAIQMRSKPVDHNQPQYAPSAAPAAPTPAPAATPPATAPTPAAPRT